MNLCEYAVKRNIANEDDYLAAKKLKQKQKQINSLKIITDCIFLGGGNIPFQCYWLLQIFFKKNILIHIPHMGLHLPLMGFILKYLFSCIIHLL